MGFDKDDAAATVAASKYIPAGGYKQFLKVDGLMGKRIGILRRFFNFSSTDSSYKNAVFESHFDTMR